MDVVYYQGVGEEDVIISHYFDLLTTVDGWQFVCGSFDTDYERAAGDTNSYNCLKAIDIYCEYSDQIWGYALFDNISVVDSSAGNYERYYYYSNGLLARKQGVFYNEFYFYDNNRNVTRIANNEGELTDYVYTSNNLVDYTVDYDFTYLGTYLYPYNYTNHDSLITKIPKTKTDYTYNAYGLLESVVTCSVTYDEATGALIQDTSVPQISE